MTTETQRWIKEFLAHTGDFYFPQPVVADAIKIKQTTLNTWRKDNVLWQGGWKKNGRIKYTADGLIAAGLMAEFSWLFGPTLAARFVDERMFWIRGLRDDQEMSFLNEVAYSFRPTPGHTTISIGSISVEREHSDEPYLIRSTEDEFSKRDLFQSSRVIFPIGRLVQTWALRTLSIMDRHEEVSDQ
jgi:hypothetical protein